MTEVKIHKALTEILSTLRDKSNLPFDLPSTSSTSAAILQLDKILRPTNKAKPTDSLSDSDSEYEESNVELSNVEM